MLLMISEYNVVNEQELSTLAGLLQRCMQKSEQTCFEMTFDHVTVLFLRCIQSVIDTELQYVAPVM
jgi:hypothetical protein